MTQSIIKAPHNDYGLPGWASKDTLVVANSYSGNTEETLSSLDEAFKRGCSVAGLSTGGKIGEMIKEGRVAGAILWPTTNPPNFPKSGLGVSLGGLLRVISSLGVIGMDKEELFASVGELEGIRKSWLKETKEESNEAKTAAKGFVGKIPVLLGARPFLGSLHAGRNVINELGHTFANYYDFPELNHHLVEAASFPKQTLKFLKYFIFESSFYPERVKLRIKVTKEVFATQDIRPDSYLLKGKSEFVQALEVAHFCGWVSFYPSMYNLSDPGPEDAIIKLKTLLSQPVH